MNVNDARVAYATILMSLKKERGMRERVLSEPRKSAAIKEIDAAMDALLVLGRVVWMAVDAGLLGEDVATVPPEQAPLLDVPEARYP